MCVLLDSDGLHVKESIKSTSPKQNSASIGGHIKITSRFFQKNLNMMLVSKSSCIYHGILPLAVCLNQMCHSFVQISQMSRPRGFYQKQSAHTIRC